MNGNFQIVTGIANAIISHSYGICFHVSPEMLILCHIFLNDILCSDELVFVYVHVNAIICLSMINIRLLLGPCSYGRNIFSMNGNRKSEFTIVLSKCNQDQCTRHQQMLEWSTL